MIADSSLAILIPIRNMDRAIKFYTRALGGKLQYRGEGEMKDFWASLKLGKNDIWLITPEKREQRKLAYSTFLVDDIRAIVTQLKRKGVKFQRAGKVSKETRIEGPIAFDTIGASAFFKDSEGNLHMIWQYLSSM
ncbi:MAG: VOC family protein [Thermoplasmata archaeon]|jgi:catechol 2,3-dioxygenase-like lactoylglutathione lyase family enzyme